MQIETVIIWVETIVQVLEHMVFKSHMESTNFKQCTADPCIFVRNEGVELSIVAVYVDDLIIITKNLETMKKIKKDFATKRIIPSSFLALTLK